VDGPFDVTSTWGVICRVTATMPDWHAAPIPRVMTTVNATISTLFIS
jgi:hypothetical protein